MTTKRRVLVTGASGYIGRKLVAELKSKGYEVVSLVRQPQSLYGALQLSLEQSEAFSFQQIQAGDLIIHLAAISAPDICQKQPELARQVNVTGAISFIQGCLEAGAQVAFASSDTVYGATATSVDELSPCQPIGDYGQMKAEVESYFQGRTDFKSLRLSYVFSREDKFTRYLCQSAALGEPVSVFDPFDRSIIYRNDLVDLIEQLACRWSAISAPVINLAGPECLSRVEFVQLVQGLVAPQLEFEIETPRADFFRARPRRIDMTSLYLAEILKRQPLRIAAAIIEEFSCTKEV